MTEEAVSAIHAVVHGSPLGAMFSAVQFSCTPVVANGSSSPEKLYSDPPVPVSRTVPNFVRSVVITVAPEVLAVVCAAGAATVEAAIAAGEVVAAEAVIVAANGTATIAAAVASRARLRIPMSTLFRILGSLGTLGHAQLPAEPLSTTWGTGYWIGSERVFR